jgi:hypothetical protein
MISRFASLFSKTTHYQGQMKLIVVSSEQDKLYKETKQQLVCCISDFYIKVWRILPDSTLTVSFSHYSSIPVKLNTQEFLLEMQRRR